MLHGHTSEVTCLAFAEPYGVLISGDSTGTIIFWAVRPSHYEQLAVLRNDQILLYPEVKDPEEELDDVVTGGENASGEKSGSSTTPTSASGGAGEGTFITVIEEPVQSPDVGTSGVHVLGVRQHEDGTYHMYTGDYRGVMRCWDLSVFLNEMEVPPDSRLTSCTAGYNPYRRVDQKGDDTACGYKIGKPHNPEEGEKKASESTLHRKHSSPLVRCPHICTPLVCVQCMRMLQTTRMFGCVVCAVGTPAYRYGKHPLQVKILLASAHGLHQELASYRRTTLPAYLFAGHVRTLVECHGSGNGYPRVPT